MRASNRIIVNTLVQYSRTILNVILSLISTRIVLNVLGQSDFGLYSLVGGVVSLLSFLTNSLVASTQRFLSYNQGKNDVEKVKEVFNNSMIIHLLLGFVILLIFEFCSNIFFDGFLNIPEDRINASLVVYHQVVFMVFISLIMAPYRAVLISRENITFISIIDVLDGVLKLLLVIIMPYSSMDKLILYGWIMLDIRLFNLFAFAIYGHVKYEECIFPRFRMMNVAFIKQIFSFTGWIMYSSFCIAFRNQGFAIVLNKFMGTAANAAYGIGTQISGYISFVSSSFSTAVGPQLMKSEGANNRNHMLYLAKFQSKISYLLLAMVTIPTLFEVHNILELWLGNVPEYASLFAIMFMLVNLVDMLTEGLASANRAVGKIGLYTILAFTPKLLILPFSWLCLRHALPIWTVALSFILVETFCMLMRIPIVRKSIKFNVRDYFYYVFVKIIPPTILTITICIIITNVFDFRFRFLLTYIVSMPLYLLAVYKFSLTLEEQNKIKEIVLLVKNKIVHHKSF